MLYLLLVGAIIGIIIAILKMLAAPMIDCPTCNNKMLFLKDSVIQCHHCKTRYLIDINTREIQKKL